MSAVSSGEKLTKILNATLKSLETVIPVVMTREQTQLVQGPISQTEMGVLIGLTHDVRGRLILQGSQSLFSKVSQSMYGMALDGEMLESFTGELGNMLAGNMATAAAEDGLSVDISPPTVLVGETKLSGFKTSLLIPINLENIGKIGIVLIIESEQ